jgi:hypothetical protein
MADLMAVVGRPAGLRSPPAAPERCSTPRSPAPWASGNTIVASRCGCRPGPGSLRHLGMMARGDRQRAPPPPLRQRRRAEPFLFQVAAGRILSTDGYGRLTLIGFGVARGGLFLSREALASAAGCSDAAGSFSRRQAAPFCDGMPAGA